MRLLEKRKDFISTAMIDSMTLLSLSDTMDKLLTTHPNSSLYMAISIVTMQLRWVLVPLSLAIALQQSWFTE